MKEFVVCGKRKTAIAKAVIKKGEGDIRVNKKPIKFFSKLQQLELKEPLMITKDILGELKFDISVSVRGGGINSRIEDYQLQERLLSLQNLKKLNRLFYLMIETC